MTSFRLNARRPIDPPADDGFEVSYVPDDGAVHRMPLARAWEMPLERALPVRRFTSRKGQRHLSGLWWSATTGGHGGRPPRLEGRGRTRQLLAGQRCDGAGPHRATGPAAAGAPPTTAVRPCPPAARTTRAWPNPTARQRSSP